MTEPTDPKATDATTAEKPARKRRTKAEIEAANASDDSPKARRPNNCSATLWPLSSGVTTLPRSRNTRNC